MARVERVILAARDIVRKKKPRYGYVDVGDALVSFLRGEMTEEETIELLRSLEQDYQKDRP